MTMHTVCDKNGVSTIALKLCPFCGSEAELCLTSVFWVRCTNDKCSAETSPGENGTRIQAAEIWNRRDEVIQNMNECSTPNCGNFAVTEGRCHDCLENLHEPLAFKCKRCGTAVIEYTIPYCPTCEQHGDFEDEPVRKIKDIEFTFYLYGDDKQPCFVKHQHIQIGKVAVLPFEGLRFDDSNGIDSLIVSLLDSHDSVTADLFLYSHDDFLSFEAWATENGFKK